MLVDYADKEPLADQPGLRDVIDTDDLPLDAKKRNFAFTSHLDFVAFDAETHLRCSPSSTTARRI